MFEPGFSENERNQLVFDTLAFIHFDGSPDSDSYATGLLDFFLHSYSSIAELRAMGNISLDVCSLSETSGGSVASGGLTPVKSGLRLIMTAYRPAAIPA